MKGNYSKPREYLDRFYPKDEQKLLPVEITVIGYTLYASKQDPPFTADAQGMRELLEEIKGIKKPKRLEDQIRELQQKGEWLY